MDPILVVDDEPAIRRILGEWLMSAGHSYVEAEDTNQALAVMKTTPCPVVFVDVQMPGRDGLWLTRELRTTYPTTAVVLATGVSNVPPTISMQAGVLAYLLKPFERDRVVAALNEALGWHQHAVQHGAAEADAAVLDGFLKRLG